MSVTSHRLDDPFRAPRSQIVCSLEHSEDLTERALPPVRLPCRPAGPPILPAAWSGWPAGWPPRQSSCLAGRLVRPTCHRARRMAYRWVDSAGWPCGQVRLTPPGRAVGCWPWRLTFRRYLAPRGLRAFHRCHDVGAATRC